MDMSLREFIRMTVGDVEAANPWVYDNITGLLDRVGKLEAGNGLTVAIPDVISLNMQKATAYNGMIDNVIVPANGTVKGFYGAATTAHTNVTLRILRTSTVLGSQEFTGEVTDNPQFFSLDMPVQGGDVLTFFLNGYTSTEDQTPEVVALEEGTGTSTPDFTEVMGSFLIQLPAKTYSGGSNA